MELKKYISKFLPKKHKKAKKCSEKDDIFRQQIFKIVGYKVHNLELFEEAFSPKSSSRNLNKKNYERLEFLGDSVLGTIIAHYLFQIYPDENEGFLTQMRSKIVNRKNLNNLGEDLKLSNLLRVDNQSLLLGENISGNLLEAMIGAIYLDVDYELCKEIVLGRILTPSRINNLENKIISYKGLLLEWSQKKKTLIKYETCEEYHRSNKYPVFRCYVWLHNKKIANAVESSKKKAEEKAAQRAYYMLSKKKIFRF